MTMLPLKEENERVDVISITLYIYIYIHSSEALGSLKISQGLVKSGSS